MSRIIRTPYQPGDIADPTRANTEFGAFSQAGAIDGANLRDAAIDLPQLDTGIILRNAATVELGTGAAGWRHGAPRTAPSSVVAPATKTPLTNGAGAPTPLGPIAWTMASGEVLRVYWDLSVRSIYAGTPWAVLGGDGEVYIPLSPGPGVQPLNLGAHCWLISLQWDVTNATLTNWVDVSGQTAYSSAVGGRTGGRLADSPASVPFPAWRLSTLNISAGTYTGSSVEVDEATGWSSVSGAWYYTPTGAITIYGLRLVIHGLYHPAQTASENYLVVDPVVGGVGQYLEYDGGTMVALHQRMGV